MSIDEQVALLMQGTNYGDDLTRQSMANELRARLQAAQSQGRALRVYCGFDPRTSDLHLGHTIPMRKLRQFQQLGHEVVFLIGNYTSLIGDPSDKDKLRPRLAPAEVEENARTYAEQAFKILDRGHTLIRHNADWLSQLTFADLINIASNFTVQQFLTRENFARRMQHGDPIYLHETFYALMQAYDAVALQTDVQVGGSDQLFNILTAGRKLQEAFGQKPQVAIILDILPGTDGEVKMSKSLGNHIPILASPEDMYGKVMSLPDHAMPIYFKLVTRYGPDRIAAMEQGLSSGELHPRDVKMELAREIVSIFHDEETAQRAESHFRTVFQQGALPDNIPIHRLAEPKALLDLLVESKLVSSKSEARRLVRQGGVYLDGVVIEDLGLLLEPDNGDDGRILRVGKRKFLRVN